MTRTRSLESQLKQYFGYNTFRTGQKEIISRVLQGKDVLGILPTGTGKSICYQLPARLNSGLTIVVSPLISLMMDQVKELRATNFKEVVALNSFLDFEQRRRIYRTLHQYKLLYVSPEILQQKELQHLLSKQQISLFVVDEAHCISQWGHEFRPDYQKLNHVIRMLGNPPILALSATATKDVQKDIIASLERPAMEKLIYPMDRSNIALSIQEVSNNEEKLELISSTLSNYHVPTLIYFSSKLTAENVSRLLTERLPNHRIAFYHGGMEQMDRISIQQQFMNNQIDVICCTSAFGMGINKNNIRLVFHYHFPSQIESFIQEIGRAGRDGKQSISILLYNQQDEFLPRQLMDSELPTDEDLSRVYRIISQFNQTNSKFPTDTMELAASFEISETQWRFIQAQLEKHGLFFENSLQYEQSKLTKIFQLIRTIRDERLFFKQRKLHEMISWIQSDTCLRESLYTKFQEGYTEVTEQCCSICGIDLQAFKPEEVQSQRFETSWEMKLKRLLVVGEQHEAK